MHIWHICPIYAYDHHAQAFTYRGSLDVDLGFSVGLSPSRSSGLSPMQGDLAVGCIHRVEVPA